MIVVTGASTGIGRAVAADFVSAGRHVVITGRDTDRLNTTAGEIGAAAIRCDHTLPADLRRLAERCDDVEVLVNNVGGNASIGATAADGLDAVQADWETNYKLNVLSAVLTVEALDDKLRDGARVINIGSIAAEYGAGSYGPAKAALSSWSVALATSMGPRGITVNTIAPGYVSGTEFFGVDGPAPERVDHLREATAIGRVGRPADIAATVSYLASPDAGWITGQTLHVNGGANTTR